MDWNCGWSRCLVTGRHRRLGKMLVVRIKLADGAPVRARVCVYVYVCACVHVNPFLFFVKDFAATHTHAGRGSGPWTVPLYSVQTRGKLWVAFFHWNWLTSGGCAQVYLHENKNCIPIVTRAVWLCHPCCIVSVSVHVCTIHVQYIIYSNCLYALQSFLLHFSGISFSKVHVLLIMDLYWCFLCIHPLSYLLCTLMGCCWCLSPAQIGWRQTIQTQI